jgi:hypothetical protein
MMRESAIGIALTTMLTAACGGHLDGDKPTATDDKTTPAPSATTDDPVPPPTHPPQAPPFDETTCGEGGGRLQPTDLCGSTTRQVPCDLADAGTGEQLDCKRLCMADVSACAHQPTSVNVCNRIECNIQADDGGRVLRCYDACPGGRRPGGYGGERSTAETSLGRAFARLAQLESVSIAAFGRLAGEIEAFGLSASLAARARDARRDEVRHARDTWALARRFGASPSRLEKLPAAHARSLVDLAIENAEEGCVREAYGAVVAGHQAARARDPEVRRVMAAIACDEAEHAELAWAIHEELMTKLDTCERARVAAALSRAWTALASEVARAETDADLRTEAGLPDRTAALLGLRELEKRVNL